MSEILNNKTDITVKRKVVPMDLATLQQLKVLCLTDSIARNYSDNLLLSGGLDSSIVLLYCIRKNYSRLHCRTEAPDVSYARLIAHMYSKQHREIILPLNELFQVVESVIDILKTFDPIEIRNSSVIFDAI